MGRELGATPDFRTEGHHLPGFAREVRLRRLRRPRGTEQALGERTLRTLHAVAYVTTTTTFFRETLQPLGAARLFGLGNASPYPLRLIKQGLSPTNWTLPDASVELAPGALLFDLDGVLAQRTLPLALVVGVATIDLEREPVPALSCFTGIRATAAR